MASSLQPERSSLATFIRKNRNELGLAVATLVVIAFTSFVSDSYRTFPAENAKLILRDTALLGIFALGAATVIIAGGIDLSSGSVIAFSGTICTGIILLLAPTDGSTPITDDLPLWILGVAILATLFAAFLIGSFHTWLITVIELPPFVATLASLVGLRSLAKLLIQDMTRVAFDINTGKSNISINDDTFLSLGNEWWIPPTIFVVLSLLLWLLLSKTVVGRHLYAMGGNEEAARLSGIRVERLKWLAYCIGTLTAAIAGILYTSYVGTAEPTRDGLGYELNAIAAAVVGGCSLAGGIGTVPGVMLGALFLRVVIDSVAKTFKSRPDLFEGLVVGVLVVLAVAFNELRGSRGLKKHFFPGALGLLNLLILTTLAGTITFVTSTEDKMRNGLVAAGATFVLLAIRAVAERLSRERAAAG
ncbi:Ribose transport system permease protein RbsC [Maioricimonas rarisocia]|uniref:Ribose transport system permease protein RbsC n=1 Tax=Maioricimonas rarisocia TaxID=2528026 RepID=A0A517ZFC5_9PLAN|nr:ABC transporter permease [Maioricimonas rarisocia]QDU41132.1 Ribose transport system permease protein RbsC [Maioricimonas rarisocia]